VIDGMVTVGMMIEGMANGGIIDGMATGGMMIEEMATGGMMID